MENIFGGLIEFENEKDFDMFITNMDEKDDALSIIEKSIEYAHKRGIFTVQEIYFIYKCLKKLKQ
jgi:hypothetical protein